MGVGDNVLNIRLYESRRICLLPILNLKQKLTKHKRRTLQEQKAAEKRTRTIRFFRTQSVVDEMRIGFEKYLEIEHEKYLEIKHETYLEIEQEQYLEIEQEQYLEIEPENKLPTDNDDINVTGKRKRIFNNHGKLTSSKQDKARREKNLGMHLPNLIF